MPVITLSTDIGQTDYIAGAIKGQLLTADASNNVVDITHQLSQNNYQHTAYLCNNAFRHFPKGAFHIIIVNLFESMPHHMLIAEHNSQYIACPDNGILTIVCGVKPLNVVAVEVDTVHGFGVLACTQALALAIKQLGLSPNLQHVGRPITDIKEKYPLRSTIGANWIDSQIIFIDSFENVVINITKEEFEEHRRGRSFKIIFTRDEVIDKLSDNYASVPPGDKLAWFNSAGYLEIAINKGNMAGLFGLKGYTENAVKQAFIHNKLLYQTVRIFFVD
ncbi:MAG TPA: SAM-dependent chlorinase/fluorinase [Chitinophagaceae bacterium]|nr:SAM-dependent chlorinase/fluorinase [Chitinophagaceae bacterium]